MSAKHCAAHCLHIEYIPSVPDSLSCTYSQVDGHLAKRLFQAPAASYIDRPRASIETSIMAAMACVRLAASYVVPWMPAAGTGAFRMCGICRAPAVSSTTLSTVVATTGAALGANGGNTTMRFKYKVRLACVGDEHALSSTSGDVARR